MVDSLKFLKGTTIDCSTDLYWRIIATGDKAIPFLIEKLNDTHPTNFKSGCKKTNLNVAEVAYAALTHIMYMPMYVMTHIQFDVIRDGCWSFYECFYNDINKIAFQKMVRDWYAKEKKNYRLKRIPKSEFNDCYKKFKIKKYLIWKGKF
jgi:hypothetical protein